MKLFFIFYKIDKFHSSKLHKFYRKTDYTLSEKIFAINKDNKTM